MVNQECGAVLEQFALASEPFRCERYGFGHINQTYLVETVSGSRYILQRINNHIFRDIPALMENIVAVTQFLQKKVADPRGALHVVPTNSGASYLRRKDGGYWRVYDFVEGSICLQAPRTPMDFYQSAVAFGRFQQLLADFPADSLHEPLTNFHNTPDRYRIFNQALKADVCSRAAQAQGEIAFALAREDEAGTLVQQLLDGRLPLRVTHNDTKLNNVLLDKTSNQPLCVIDLDTVMPGLSVYDYGDSIRFGAASAAEDETDLTKMELNLELFRTYTHGFLRACPDLTPQERLMLPMGAKLMTLECGVRFLTDYLEGDHYFGIQRPAHNLDRCRTQFKLVADMEKKWEQMCNIAASCL